ncbi:MAG: acylneuraminate cytidylyltransferase family protein [Methanobacteriota archaeon]
MEQILAIIPARGGSKRLPKKNIMMFSGKPLLAYTIEAAQKSRYINRLIVSTEDKEIAHIAASLHAEIINRPTELAQDASSTEDVIDDVLQQLHQKEHYSPDIILLLQPTSPLRTTNDIDNAIELFLNTPCESLISVTEYEHNPYWALRIKKGVLYQEFEKGRFKRSQELPILYRPNGSLFLTRTKTFNKYRSFYTKHMIPFILPRERSIDIDDEYDFSLAEFLYQKTRGEKK